MYLHNLTEAAKTYQGREIAADDFFEITFALAYEFAMDSDVVVDLANGDLALSDDGSTDLELTAAERVKALQRGLPAKTVADLAQGGDQFCPFGHGFTATAGTTTTSFKKLPETLKFQGGDLFTDGAAMGDSVTCDIVDHDNVLGYGVDFVLSAYVTDWQLFPDGQHNVLKDEFSKSDPISDAFYLRYRYTSTGGTNVKVGVNMFAYRSA